MKGFKFYNPSTQSFFKMGNAKFIDDVGYNGSDKIIEKYF